MKVARNNGENVIPSAAPLESEKSVKGYARRRMPASALSLQLRQVLVFRGPCDRQNEISPKLPHLIKESRLFLQMLKSQALAKPLAKCTTSATGLMNFTLRLHSPVHNSLNQLLIAHSIIKMTMITNMETHALFRSNTAFMCSYSRAAAKSRPNVWT